MTRRFQYHRSQELDELQRLVCRPSRWGNPWEIGWGLSVPPPMTRSVWSIDVDRGLAVALYARWLDATLEEDPGFLTDLEGYELGCYCPLDQPCHADVILARLDPSVGLIDGRDASRRDIACYDIRDLAANRAPGIPLGELEDIAERMRRFQ